MILTLICITLLVSVIFSWISVLWDSRKLNLPGPFPLPIIGNSILIMGDSTNLMATFASLISRFGRIIRVYILGSRYIIVSDPKFVEALTTSTTLIAKGRSYDYLHPWLGQGLLTSTGQKWKNHRKFLTPAFHFNILRNFVPIFSKNGNILVSKLREVADGRTVNLFPVVALTALDNVTESIMGVNINAQMNTESEYVNAIKDMAAVTIYRQTNIFASQEPVFKLMNMKKVQDEAIEVLHRQSHAVIEARRQELVKSNITSLNLDSNFGIKNKYAFLDLLLLADIKGQKICNEEIREEVDTFMFEGHDTTASGIVFALYCISNHQDVQEKLFEEQKIILGDNFSKELTNDDYLLMKYLELVIKESLRLYPSVPLIERQIDHDTEIAGTFVPKNTAITVDIINMQRNADYFENPLDFKPERFESNTRNPFVWIPFSAGPRNCIGQKFAMLSMKVTISAIVRNFKIFPSGPKPELTCSLVLGSKNGVHVTLETR